MRQGLSGAPAVGVGGGALGGVVLGQVSRPQSISDLGAGGPKLSIGFLGLTRREAWRVLAALRFLFRQREMLSGGYTLGRFSLRERDNVERVDSASF
jgi:hypothetical protein